MIGLRISGFALALACAGCAAPAMERIAATEQAAPAPPPVKPPVRMRDLTSAEQQLLARSLAQSLKDPGSAQFRWSKFPQPLSASSEPAHYCATVNARNSFGGYVGHQPFLAIIAMRDGKISSGAIGAMGSDTQTARIVEKMCQEHGLSPYG